MADDALLTLTADIVAAHVSNNRVAVGDVSDLVARVYGALSGLGAAAEEETPARRQPIMSPARAVKPDTITCLVCGAKQKTLKRHLGVRHAMTPAEYREEFGLRNDYPMVAPDYAQARSEMAKKIGLGAKGRIARQGASPAAAEARRGASKPAAAKAPAQRKRRSS